MAFFPMFFDLTDKKVLAVGAGTVGGRRIEMLVRFGARVTVVSKRASESVQRLAAEGKIRWIASDYRDYRTQETRKKGIKEQRFFAVLAATGEKETDELAAEDARSFGAFVNVAGDRSRSDFYFPGIAKEGNVTAGIIADGADHALAKDMTEQMRAFLKEQMMKREKQGADGDGQ